MNDFVIPANLDPNSAQYKSIVAEMLSRIDPGLPFGTPLFNAIAKMSTSLAMEAVVLRRHMQDVNNPHRVEVYLRQRGVEEAYPGQWHAPGSVMRPGESWRDVADRLKKEFGTGIVSADEIGELFTKEERGPFLSKIFLVELVGLPREDDRHCWYPVDDLPQITVDHHKDHIIPLAVMMFAAKLGIRARARISEVVR